MQNNDSQHHVTAIKLSAIIPNYNGEQYIARALQSLVDQTEKFSEIIVVDDASTDSSLSIIHDFINRYDNVHLYRHDKNKGVNATLNLGIERATGDYILLGAVDDWYDCNSVSHTKKALARCPNVGAICGDAIVHDYDHSTFRRRLSIPAKNTLITPEELKSILRSHYVGFNGGGMYINRQLALSVGMLAQDAAWYADWLLYAIAALSQGLYYVDEVMVHMVKRQESYSEGKRIWKKERPAITNTLLAIQRTCPALWNDFKNAALLPHYELRYLSLMFSSTPMRQYCSIRLLWRLLMTNKVMVRIGRLFPYDVVLQVRKLLRA